MLRRTIFAVLNLTLTDAELRVWHFAAFTMFTFVCIGGPVSRPSSCIAAPCSVASSSLCVRAAVHNWVKPFTT